MIAFLLRLRSLVERMPLSIIQLAMRIGVGGVDSCIVLAGAAVTGVAEPVAVGVRLRRVGDERADVARITEAVAVGVASRVRQVGTGIARVADVVAVAILLGGVGEARAVVARVAEAVPVGIRVTFGRQRGTAVERIGESNHGRLRAVNRRHVEHPAQRSHQRGPL